MENKISFLKTDNNTIINEQSIKWIKKMNDCLQICTKNQGCNVIDWIDTHRICKNNSPDTFNKYNEYFK